MARARRASPSLPLLARLLSILAVGPAACGDDGPHFVPASADPGQNLMVIDEGFDLTAAEFSGKLVAAYTFECLADPSSGGSDDGGPLGIDGLAGGDSAAQKQEILSSFATRDNTCHLRPGIIAKSDPLASVERFRARWNAALKSDQPPAFTADEWQTLMPALNDALDTFPFHGTATAGTAAHENDAVRLVLVERTLGDSSTLVSTYTCVAQADVDRFTALYGDPDVMAAAASQPVATLDADLNQVMAAHAVGLVNESFGSPSRPFLEQLQTQAGCPATDFTGYFTTLANLELAQQRGVAAAATAPVPLTVRAAGNDGAQIDSPADALDCDLGDPLNLSVGSLALDGSVSSFSNHGACVDIYAPGEAVVAPVAAGWYFAVDGTSFSAPLIARTLSLAATAPYAAAQARTALLTQNAGDGELLPAGDFPSDLFYQPASTSSALVAGPVAPAMRRTTLPARIDLHRLLGPLTRRRRGIP